MITDDQYAALCMTVKSLQKENETLHAAAGQLAALASIRDCTILYGHWDPDHPENLAALRAGKPFCSILRGSGESAEEIALGETLADALTNFIWRETRRPTEEIQ
jgi:hypothetical protein